MPLSHKATMLLQVLVGHLDNVRPGRPQTYPTYGQVAVALGYHNIQGPIGRFLQPRGLTELATWTMLNNHPGITGLIVLQAGHIPGEGYFELFNKRDAPDMYQWWEEEIRRSIAYNWVPYITHDARL
jgi:hypothetical protein